MQMVAYIFTYIWASDILTFVIASSANALKLAVEMTKKVCTSAGRSGMFSTDGLKPRGSRRVVYVSDPSSVANRYLPDPVREEDLKRWIDAIAAAEIDTFVQEVYTQGGAVYWRGDVFEYDARPQHRRFLPLLDSGVQPLEILIDRCHHHGIEFFAGFRVSKWETENVSAFASSYHVDLSTLP